MAKWRQAVELAMTEEEAEVLTALSRSRTEPASRVSRAAMLLAYRENPSFFAVGRRLRVHHQTVQRCVERAVAHGALAALDDRPRPGKEPTITPEAKAWLVSLACDKAKDHGYTLVDGEIRVLVRKGDNGCMANDPDTRITGVVIPGNEPPPHIHPGPGSCSAEPHSREMSLLSGVQSNPLSGAAPATWRSQTATRIPARSARPPGQARPRSGSD